MFKKPLGLLGIFLVVVGIGYFVGAGVAYSKVQGGYGSLQSFSEAQNVTLNYNDEGQLVDRGTVEGAEAIMTLLTDDWNFPVVDGDMDPNDRDEARMVPSATWSRPTCCSLAPARFCSAGFGLPALLNVG